MTDAASLPDAPFERLSPRQEVENAFAAVKGVIKAALKPPPTQTGDGSYLALPQPTSLLGHLKDDLGTIIQDLRHTNPKDVKILVESAKAKLVGITNDKTYLMEDVITVSTMTTGVRIHELIIIIYSVGGQARFGFEIWWRLDGQTPLPAVE